MTKITIKVMGDKLVRVLVLTGISWMVSLAFVATYGQEVPPIYVSIVSHNEEPRPGGSFPDFTQDEDTFWVHRNAVVRFAKMLHEKGVKYNFQSEWNFLLAATMFDTGTASTNGKNFLKYLVEDLGFEADPHAHETKYNYADVAYLMSQLLGGEPSHTVGGYIAYPPEQSKIEYFRDTLYGWHYDYAWKAEILWGGATPGHEDEDSLYAAGIWKPKDNENYLVHDEYAPLPEVGRYLPNWTGLYDLLAKQEAGELRPGRIYTITIFVSQNFMLDTNFINTFREKIESLQPYVDSGRIVWVGLAEVVDIWRTQYEARPNIYSWLAGDITNPIRDTLWLEMDDGVHLDATLFRPVDPTPEGGFPAIIFVHGLGGSKLQMEPRAEYYARRGYVTLAYSVRGQGRSEGLSTIFSYREQQDLDSIIGWLASLPYVNDTLIGVSGASQGGYHSWLAAVRHMGVRAVAPENSTPKITDAMARYGCYELPVTSGMDWLPNVRVDTIAYPIKRWLLADNYDSVRAIIGRGREFDSTDVANSDAHYLMMGAWHDHIFWHNRVPGAFAVAPHRPIMYLGTGGHGSEVSPQEQTFRNELREMFFDEKLKGEYRGLDTIKPVIVAIGPNWEHMEFDKWPPEGVTTVTYYMHADGTLSDELPGVGDSSYHIQHQRIDPMYTWEVAVNDHFRHATQAFIQCRRTWRTAPFTDTIIILGIPTATVYAKSTASRMQINLQLYDELPNGTPVYLTQISMGVRDNPDTSQWHTLQGEFTIVGWKLPPGHRLRLDWTSINQTLGDTSLWTIPYWDADGTLTMGLDAEHPSHICVPMMIIESVSELQPMGMGIMVYPSIITNYVNIKLKLNNPATVAIKIYNLIGQVVDATKVHKSAGMHVIRYDCSKLPAGVYFVNVRVGDINRVTKLCVFRDRN